jgi:hypothetical protein
MQYGVCGEVIKVKSNKYVTDVTVIALQIEDVNSSHRKRRRFGTKKQELNHEAR